ncbi:MAG: TonB-dependent receptor [Bacteroidales bacterium]|jgi:outer membrane receptor protein involved in Fe transport|nr:TonB-dependent receptor [Bacteroidales bacterium]
MKRVTLFLISFIISSVSILYASETDESAGNISGKVIDGSTQKAMEFANISVWDLKTNELVKGTITDLSGEFQLSGLEEGDYKVVISFVGYTTIEKTVNLKSGSKKVNVVLNEDAQAIGEVQILGQQSQMRLEIDKKVFNVDQSIAATGGSASDVLSNIPSVEVDNEGEVSLRGNSSVTVWINGKASGLSSDNRAQILEQMPAENIERIEVITNPSAKYDPEGTAGIINIVLKKDRKAGYYGSVQVGADNLGGYNVSGNFNYSSGKLDAYASLGKRSRKREGGGYTNRDNTDADGNVVSYLNQTSDSDGDGGPYMLRTGMTYHASDKDHLSLGVFGMLGDMDQDNTILYESNVPGSFTSSSRNTSSDNRMKVGNMEIGYKRDFTEKSNLDITLSYNLWDRNEKSTYLQNSLFADGHENSSYQYQESKMKTKTWEAQADYVNEFRMGKIEAGYKGTMSRQNSPVETFSGPNKEEAVHIASLYNKFIYDQDVHALYATYSAKIKSFGVQVGARGEYSNIHTSSLGYNQSEDDATPHNKEYFSFFPSVFFSYQLPKNNEVQLNYTRRISRPWGRQLNPFINITDSTNISFGNPSLDPEFSNSLEFNYLKTWQAHTLSTSLYYRNTDDVIQRINYLQDNVMKSTYENITETQSAGAEFVLKNRLFKFLDLTTTVNLFYYILEGYSYQPDGVVQPITGKGNEDFSWNARMIANMALPYSFTLQLTGNYNAKQIIAQGHRKANYSLDAGLRKSFFDRKLSLTVNARDLLNSRKWHTITSGPGFEQDSKNWRSGRQFGFTLTYNFGNMKNNNRSKNQRSDENMMNQMDEDF